jgi:ABC-type sugar transport system ATPase subunit
LIGSPSMNLFDAQVGADGIMIEAYPIPLPLQTLRLGKIADGQKVTVGFWPEDIGFLTTASPGYAPATLWATDFRGKDQAIEARLGVNRVRKVVPASLRLAQGDVCFFHLDPVKAFVFAFPSGERIASNSSAAK